MDIRDAFGPAEVDDAVQDVTAHQRHDGLRMQAQRRRLTEPAWVITRSRAVDLVAADG